MYKIATPSKPGRPRGASGPTPLQRRHVAFFRAVVQAHGSLGKIRQLLNISQPMLAQRLSHLRTLGVAKTVTVVDRAALGETCLSTIWVRLAGLAPVDIEVFEQELVADEAVASANRVSGDWDYRLSTYHADQNQAAQWTRALQGRKSVARAEQVVRRPIFGNELPGFVLRGRTGGEA